MTAPSIEDALASGLHAADAGRRVAWRKFYELQDRYQRLCNTIDCFAGLLDATSIVREGLSPDALDMIRRSFKLDRPDMNADAYGEGFSLCYDANLRHPVAGTGER